MAWAFFSIYASIVLEATMILEITHSNNCEELVDISFACFDRPNRKAEFLITDRHQVSMLRLQPRRSNDVSNDVWIYDAENVTIRHKKRKAERTARYFFISSGVRS